MRETLTSVACFLITVICIAQQYPFVHYTPKDGLVNSRVRKAYQDSKGRMYFITYGGLSVFDGTRFKNYTTQNGLLISLVNDVLEVGEDSLLVAVNTCGLNLLVRGQMKKINIHGAHCPVINNFLKSRDGNIYVAADDGLYKWKQTEFEKLSTSAILQNDTIEYLGPIAEHKDFLVFGTNDLKSNTGLFIYDKKKNLVTDALQKQYVYSLKKDHTDIIWINTGDKIRNLDTAALDTGRLVLIKPYVFTKTDEVPAGNIVFNRQNEPIISSSKITKYRKDGTRLDIRLPDQPSFVARDFFSDFEDVLWICHDGNGLYKLPNTKLQSAVWDFDKSKYHVKALRSNTPDSCWIMTTHGRLWLHTSSNRKFFNFTPAFTANTLFYSGNYLYATDLNKLYYAEMPVKNETTLRFRQILSLPDHSGFGEHFVTDPYGNIIFFETRNICVLQNNKVVFRYPIYSPDLIEGLHIDQNKQLWVVSRGGGLQLFSIHPENLSLYLQEKQQFTNELEAASPRCMTVDKNGLFWIGTRYDGLIAFEYKNNRLIKKYHFQTENGLTDNFVTSLACDRYNNIVIGTQTGLDRLIRTKNNTFRIENVTKSNNVFAYIDKIWTDTDDHTFALTNASAVFQIESVQNDPAGYEPQLLIEEIKVNGKPVIHNTVAPLRLRYFQRNISFSVAAPSFINERQVKYSYLLSGGGNKEWSDTTSIADINLLNLSPGNYSLQVKSFFPSTAYSPKEIDFSFIIRPPWWQTLWFRIPGVLLMLAVLTGSIRFYYRRKLEKQKALLEKKQAVEKERTRIATDMHDDLGAGLSRIKFLSETIGIKKQLQQSIDEDIVSIREYSHEMIDKMGEIVWALNEKNDSLSDLLSYTRSYAVEYLSQNGIKCAVSLPDSQSSAFISGEFRRNIYLTVKEALHNVVKHAQATSVDIHIRTGPALDIFIQDNGTGFDEKNVRPLGNGLANMKKRIKEIGGRFDILNSEGTLIRISVPLTR